jgi:Spy/CpxP family protein refolding chaperone
VKVFRNLLLAGLIALVSSTSAAALQDPPPPVPPNQRPAEAQRGRQGQGPPAVRPGMPIQQLQAMFDAYALVQAQKALRLSEEQYQRFFTRMNRLQDVRRQHMQRRMRILNELRRRWRPETGEAELVTLTKQLDELETTYDSEHRTARRAIDEVLTPRQIAFFRFFEEDMERQKLEFITRSRQKVP